MRVRACGVRGSTPAPGAEFVHVGGHTSCLAVWADGDRSPRLILDAGTGIRSVSQLLDGDAFVGSILLTHLHWDHVQGLPFFGAADRDDARVRLLLPLESLDHHIGLDRDASALAALRRSMSPPHFPIGPEGLRGDWSFGALDEGMFDIEGFEVTAREIPHKGGVTFGFRISDGSSAVAYLPDHLPAAAGEPGRAGALALADGVDLLIHDAQFTAEEAVLAELYGHSTIEQAIDLAIEAGAATLVLTHHSPARTDEAVADLERRYADCGISLVVAREGMDLLGVDAVAS